MEFNIVNLIIQLIAIDFFLVGLIMFLIFGILTFLFTSKYNGTPYQGEFIPETKIVSRFNKGFSVSGKRFLTIKSSYENLIGIGGTGTGKSSVIAIPSLLKPNASFVIFDPSGELYNHTSGYLIQIGYNVRILRFVPPFSEKYNPLHRCLGSQSIRKVANMIYRSKMGNQSKDPFWEIQGNELIGMMISIVKSFESRFQNLYNVSHLIDLLGSNPKILDNLVVDTGNDQLFNRYRAFLEYDSKLRSNIIATSRASLVEFSDSELGYVTSSDSINLSIFRQNKSALFISIPVAEQNFYRSIVSLLFEQLFSEVLAEIPPKESQPILFLIDEAGILKIPILPTAISNIRKYQAGICLLIQDESQLYDSYGGLAKSIITNCNTKVTFTNSSLEKSQEMEKILGRREFTNEKGHKMIASLMTADAIRSLDPRFAIMLHGHHRATKLRLRPYFKNWKLKNRSEIQPVAISNDAHFEPPPLLSELVTT